MPVPFVIKNTFIMQTNSYGFSESFLFQSSSGDLNVHIAAMDIIAQKRAALLGNDSFIKAIRVSVERDDLEQPRRGDAFLKYVNYLGATTPNSDDPDTGVLITMRNLVAQRRRNMFLRGIWDDINNSGGFYLPSIAGWQTAFDSWRVAMLAKGIGWWSDFVAASSPITGYTVAAATQKVSVVTDPGFFNPFPAPRQRVRIAGLNGQSVLNGLHVVDPTASGEFDIVKPIAAAPFATPGTATRYATSFEQASTIDAQKIVTRRAGAPLLQSAGRRRARPRT